MNHFISLQEAIDMTSLYRAEQENILKPEFQNKGILARSEAFDRLPFDILLGKKGCAGLRFYYGMSADLNVHAIIVATDSNGNDLLPAAGLVQGTEEDIAERGIRCPDLCPTGSVLNS